MSNERESAAAPQASDAVEIVVEEAEFAPALLQDC